jgi:hypothetical protein
MKFTNNGNGFFITPEVSIQDRLPGGAYKLSYSAREERIYFQPIRLQYDKLVDLPSDEFTQVMNEMDKFLSPETKRVYDEHGFIYKRSMFLHGDPGTGKSCIINRVSEKVEKMQGVILFSTNPGITMMALEILKNLSPEVLTMVIFEEFDQILEEGYEEEMLKLLDGQVQKPNTIYLATTNFLNKIPKRMLRPGRFSRVIQVLPPSFEARHKYIELVSKNKSIIKPLAEKTEGFTIDQLKESVLSINCLGYSIEDTIARIRETTDITERLKNNAQEDDVEFF